MKSYEIDGKSTNLEAAGSSPEAEFRNYKRVTGNVMQDALNVWSDLWGELQGQMDGNSTGTPKGNKAFEPSCGWAEFQEKMWRLKHYLDFAKRLSK